MRKLLLGNNNPAWKGGKPKCLDCKTITKDYHSKRCLDCFKKYNHGKNHGNWKGDGVGYRAIHEWVDRWLGKPQHCSICNDISNRRYHWSNVSGQYLRIKADWIRLCVPCHKNFDKDKKRTKDIFAFRNSQFFERKEQQWQ
jgi:hypothetical protein